MDPNSSDTPDGGWPETGGSEGVAAANGKTPDPDDEQVRDRRLLRFVYATAALTGVLAVVIYAGGWFFDTPEQSEQASGKPAQMASKPPQTDASPQDAGKPKVGELKRLTPSSPPAPPAPVAPPKETTAAPRDAGKPAPSRTIGGMAGDAAAKPGQAAVTGAGDAAPAATQPQAEVAPSKAPPAPAKPVQETAPVKPEPVAEAKAPPPAPKKPAAVAKAAPRATATPTPSATGRYYAQLGSVTSEAGAKKFWGKVQKKFPDILGEYDLVVQKRAVANRGTFYRVQVGRFATFKEVRGLCDMLKARKQGCLPVKR